MCESNDVAGGAIPSDQELMTRIGAEDRDALGILARRHQARVLAIAYRFLGRWDAAEDVCQETFLRVYRRASTYRPEAQLTTWLYRIVSNLCWDFRRKARRQAIPAESTIVPQAALDSSDSATRRERADRVRNAIAALPDRQRLAVVLHRYEGMSHTEIAEVTGWSSSAVESCIVRAYAKLRADLSGLVGDE